MHAKQLMACVWLCVCGCTCKYVSTVAEVRGQPQGLSFRCSTPWVFACLFVHLFGNLSLA